MRAPLVLSLLLLLPLDRSAHAQEPNRTCSVVVDSVRGLANFIPSPGRDRLYAGGGVFVRCAGQPTTMQSDSVAWFQEAGELRMVGNVKFRDSTALLDSDHATYWVREERLRAEGNVYTRNLRTGSEMRGPNLDYYRAAPPIRDTVLLYAVGRPTMRFFSQRDSARSESAEPFVVVADRVRMFHSDRMWGSGNVTIDRSDLHARADSAHLNLADSLGYLIGAPEVVGRDTAAPADSNTYRLTGQRIRFELTGRHQIRRAVSSGRAAAGGPDWTLTGDTLDIALDSGKVERAQAWGLADDDQPSARSGLSTVTGDSLDIQMPGQVMRLVWAYGRGRARSRPDSTVAEDDWLAGDTLRADFVPRDTAGRRTTELDRVDARGAARAYYHVDNEREPQGPRGITYSRGDRIRIAMAARKVTTVDVVGRMDGLYLEPLPRLALDSIRTDSTVSPSARPRP